MPMDEEEIDRSSHVDQEDVQHTSTMLTREEIAKFDPVIQEAYETLKELSEDEEFVAGYRAREAFYRNLLASERYVEERAREKGEEIGFKRGVIYMAKALVSAGVDMDTVISVTGLEPQDLE